MSETVRLTMSQDQYRILDIDCPVGYIDTSTTDKAPGPRLIVILPKDDHLVLFVTLFVFPPSSFPVLTKLFVFSILLLTLNVCLESYDTQ